MPKRFRYFSVAAILLPIVLSCARREAALDGSKRGSETPGKNDDDLAVSCSTEAIGLDPNRPQPYLDRATAYRELGNEEKAAEEERKAQELSR